MAPPRLIAIIDLPGVGKTTVAHTLAKHINAVVITSEQIVRELFPNKDHRTDRDFDVEELASGYAEMIRRAQHLLSEGRSVIVEGSFRSQAQRDAIRAVADQCNVPFTLIHVTCPDDVVRQRLAERTASGKQQHGQRAHDVVQAMFEPVEECDATVETSRDYQKVVDRV